MLTPDGRQSDSVLPASIDKSNIAMTGVCKTNDLKYISSRRPKKQCVRDGDSFILTLVITP